MVEVRPEPKLSERKYSMLLKGFAVFCAAIMLSVILSEVVQKALSEEVDSVSPLPGEDWHILFGQLESLDDNRRIVTGDIIVEGTLFINSSTLVMASVSSQIVNSITVKPWGKLFINHSHILAVDPNRPYEVFIYGTSIINDTSIRDLNGETISGEVVGGIQLFSDDIHLNNVEIVDCENGPGIYVYRCSPRIENTKCIGCKIGISVTSDNQGSSPPVPVIDRDPLTDFTGEPISFDASSSSDPDGEIRFYKWDFGNGLVSSMASPVVTYAKSGKYPVTLTVTDDSGTSASTVSKITIQNQNPNADAGPDIVGYEDEPTRFYGGASYDDDGSIVEYKWIITLDAQTQETIYGMRAAYSFITTGQYQVELIVTDDEGAVSSNDPERLFTVDVIQKPGTSSHSDWPSLLRTNRNDVVTNDLPIGLWKQRWAEYIGGYDNGLPGIVGANGRLYFWEERDGSSSISSCPAATGVIDDRKGVNHPISGAPLLTLEGTNRFLYVALEDETVMKLDADNLVTTAWSVNHYQDYQPVTSLTEGSEIYIGSYDPTSGSSKIMGLKKNDGSEDGNQILPSFRITTNIVVVGLKLIFGGIEGGIGKVVCLDLNNNYDPYWSSTLSEGAPSNISASDNTLFVGDASGDLRAFTIWGDDRGETEWVFSSGGEVRASPAIVSTSPETVLTCAMDGYVYRLERTVHDEMEIIWSFHHEFPIEMSPLVMNGDCLFVDIHGGAVMLEGETGDIIWDGGMSSGPRSPIISLDANIYVWDKTGHLRCIDPDSVKVCSGAYSWPPGPSHAELSSSSSDLWTDIYSPTPTQSFNLKVRVWNLGGPASGSFHLQAYYDVKDIQHTFGDTTLASISPGDYRIATITGSIPTSGDHILIVQIDDYGDVTEEDEDNNELTLSILINEGTNKPTIENTTIEDCDDGLMTKQATLLINNVTFLSNDREIVATSNSAVTAKNCGLTRPNIVERNPLPLSAPDNSIIYVVNDLLLTVLDPTDGEPLEDALVTIRDRTDDQVYSEYSNTIGRPDPAMLIRYLVCSSGLEWKDPYCVSVSYQGGTTSSFIVLADAPKDISVYPGGDTDNDGISDADEQSLYIVCTPAAGHCPNPSQIVTDFRSFDGRGVRPNANGVLIHDEITKAWVDLARFHVLVEARQESTAIDTVMEVAIGFADNGALLFEQISYHGISPSGQYRWYSSEGQPPQDGLDIVLKVTSSCDDVIVDRIMVLATTDLDPTSFPGLGGYSDPITVDTDRDLITDNLEIIDSRVWRQFEHTGVGYPTVTDPLASNGIASDASTAPQPEGAFIETGTISNGEVKEFQALVCGRDDTDQAFINMTRDIVTQFNFGFSNITDVAWMPDDDDATPGYQGYALLVGYDDITDDGILLKYDYSTRVVDILEILPLQPLFGVAWSEAAQNPYAIVVGVHAIYKYTPLGGGGYLFVQIPSNPPAGVLNDVDINPITNEVLMVGDGGQVYSILDQQPEATLIPNDATDSLFGVSWKPTGSEAMLVGENGRVLIYDSQTHAITGSHSNICGLPVTFQGCDWNGQGTDAIIVGNRHTIIHFSSDEFSVITFGSISDGILFDVGWKSNIDYAICVGDSGKVFHLHLPSYRLVEGRAFDHYSGIDWRSDDDYPLLVGHDSTGVFKEPLAHVYVPPNELHITIATHPGPIPPIETVMDVRVYLINHEYQWFYSSAFETDQDIWIIPEAWCSELVTSPPWGPTQPMCLIDKLMVDCLSDTHTGSFKPPNDEMVIDFIQPGEVVRDIEIPNNGIVTSAELRLRGRLDDDTLVPTFRIDAGPVKNVDIYDDWVVYDDQMSIFLVDIGVDNDANDIPDAIEDMPGIITLLCDGERPRLFEKHIVFDRGGEVRLMELDEDGTILLNKPIDLGENPDIYGDWIVYQKYENNWKVFGHHIPSNVSVQLSYDYRTDCSGDHAYDVSNPAIHENRVVWMDDYRGENDHDIFMLELNNFWTSTFLDENMKVEGINPDDVTNNGRLSAVSNDKVFGKGDVVKVSSTQDVDEIFPDIHGSRIVWWYDDHSSIYVYLLDLLSGSDPVCISNTTLVGPPPGMQRINLHPRITGNYVTWIEEGIPPVNPVVLYDLGVDTDGDTVPNYLERPLMMDDPARIVISCDANEYTMPAVYGDVVVWNDETSALRMTWQDFGLCIGDSWDEDARAWYGTEFFTAPKRTKNLAGEINAYLEDNPSATSVPIRFWSDSVSKLDVLSISIRVEVATDVLEPDTDCDGIIDGTEVFDFHGYDVLQFEDTVEYKEWVNPYKDDPDIRFRSQNFLHQSGVVLTSTWNYPYDNISPDDTQIYSDSWVKMRYSADHSGEYRIIIQPRPQTVRDADVMFAYLGGEGILDPTPVKLEGQANRIIPKVHGYLSDVINDTAWVTVTEYGDDEVAPIANSVEFQARPLYIERGVELGVDLPKGTGGPDLEQRVSVWMQLCYEGRFYLKEGCTYEVGVGIDLSLLDKKFWGTTDPPGSSFPSDLEWNHIQLLRITNLDFVRVERRSMNPLDSDSDGDGLSDGNETIREGYPLYPDPDHDGLSDLLEDYYLTSPEDRDSDNDGIRDAVELGFSPATIFMHGGDKFSQGSFFERMIHNGTPFDYGLINNYDPETILPATPVTTTDPLDKDSDNDGLPDGWIDGWGYKDKKFNEVEVRSYDDTLKYSDMKNRPYNESMWGKTGSKDMIMQIYEGEDFDCDGVVDADPGGPSTWGFYTSLERKVNPDSGKVFDETNPAKYDSESDGIPDGYEVWYSTQEPHKDPNDNYIIDPTNGNDGASDKDTTIELVADVGCDPTDDPDQTTYQYLKADGGKVVGRGFKIQVDNLSPICKISVELKFLCDVNTHAAFKVYIGDGTGTAPDGEALYEEEIVGSGVAWYTIDVPDDLFKPIPTRSETWYFVCLSYEPEDDDAWDLGWTGLENQAASDVTYYWKDGDVTMYTLTNSKLSFNLFSYGWDCGDDEVGDGVTNLQEYIVGTSPKNANTDFIYMGGKYYDDLLLDGHEVTFYGPYDDIRHGLTSSPDIPGGIILRTNVENGALSFDGYEAYGDYSQEELISNGPWIRYDGDGGGSKLEGFEYKLDLTFDVPVEDPDLDFPGFASENVLLFTLVDGTRFYLTPEKLVSGIPSQEHTYMYVFSPDTDLDNTVVDLDTRTEYRKGSCFVFKAVQYLGSEFQNYRIEDKLNGLYYRNRQIYLSDPFMLDTDSDGIRDGYERFTHDPSLQPPNDPYEYHYNRVGWRVESEMTDPSDGPNPTSVVPSDTLINCRDRDSDNDGLEDCQEPGWCVDVEDSATTDLDPDLRVCMADPDSDGDGVLDGREPGYWEDTDEDGSNIEVNIHYDGEGKDVISYNDMANMLDPDSDGDGIHDGHEIDQFRYDDQQDTKIKVFDGSNIKAIDGGGASDVFLLADPPTDIGSVQRIRAYDKRGWDVGKTYPADIVKMEGLKDLSYKNSRVYFSTGTSVSYSDVFDPCIFTYTTFDDAIALDVDNQGYIYVVNDVGVDNDEIHICTKPSTQSTLLLDPENTEIYDISIDSKRNIIYSTGNSLCLLDYPYSYDSPSENTPITLLTITPTIDYVVAGPDDSVYFAGDGKLWKMDKDYDHRPPVINNKYNYREIANGLGTITGLACDDEGSVYLLIDGQVIDSYIYTSTSVVNPDSDNDDLWDGCDVGSHKGERTSQRLYSLWQEGDSEPPRTTYLTHPLDPDMDKDGLNDGTEVLRTTIAIQHIQTVDNYLNPDNHRKIHATTERFKVSSDPWKKDTDGDGFTDTIEYGYLDPNREDTDFDGLLDWYEDDDFDGVLEATDHNGRYDKGELSPVDRDTDDDFLADGWDDDGDGTFEEGIDSEGEDWDHDHEIDPGLEPDPLDFDSDDDLIRDGVEFDYLVNIGATGGGMRDSDNDGIRDLLEYDSDNDGLSDGHENIDKDNTINERDTSDTSYSGLLMKWEGASTGDLTRNDAVIDFDWSEKPSEAGTDDDFFVEFEGFYYSKGKVVTSSPNRYYVLRITVAQTYDEWELEIGPDDTDNQDQFTEDSSSMRTEASDPNMKVFVIPLDEADMEYDNVGNIVFYFKYIHDDGDVEETTYETGSVKVEIVYHTKTADPQNYAFKPLSVSEVCYVGSISGNTYYVETLPTDPDCDDDGLMDGAEAHPFSDTDGDGFLNAWDMDSNDGIATDTGSNKDSSYFAGRADHDEVFVPLRYGPQSGTGPFTGYGSGTWIVTDPGFRNGVKNLYFVFDDSNHEFSHEKYECNHDDPIAMSFSSDDQLTLNYAAPWSSDDKQPVLTPDGNTAWKLSTSDDIYIKIEDDGDPDHGKYWKYEKVTYSGSSQTSDLSYPKLTTDYIADDAENYVRYHQEYYDFRVCVNTDSDFDGLDNAIEVLFCTNPFDADTDNDGILDGDEPLWNVDTDGDGGPPIDHPLFDDGTTYVPKINALDYDSDGDGIWDGVEIGLTECYDCSNEHQLPIQGSSDYPFWEDGGVNDIAQSPNFDQDPSTTTDPLNRDTDGDGLPDGLIPYFEATYSSSTDSLTWAIVSAWDPAPSDDMLWWGEDHDCDGEYIASKTGDDKETDPLDIDTDDDGIPDGWERVFNSFDSDPDDPHCWIPRHPDDPIADNPTTYFEGTWETPDDLDTFNNHFYPLDPLNPDTDGDTLPDSLEISWIEEKITEDTDLSKGFYIIDQDPFSKTNPCRKDTDFDGIEDDKEDTDGNGRADVGETNSSDPDSDRDYLLDGANVQKEDSDQNGFENDWLGDYFSIFLFDNQWTWPGGTEEWLNTPDWATQSNYYIGEDATRDDDQNNDDKCTQTDALNSDSDCDGLLDGNGLDGELGLYFTTSAIDNLPNEFPDIFIFDETKINPQQVPTNPGKFDTDGDGLSDGQEANGWQVTIRNAKDKTVHSSRDVFSNPCDYDSENDGINDFDEYIELSDPIRSDTDGDKILDGDETTGNLTEIEDVEPEIIGDIDASIEVVWDTIFGIPYPKEMYVKVIVKAKDNAGLDSIHVRISGEDWIVKVFTDSTRSGSIEAKFHASLKRALINGWDIKVKVRDVNGNEIEGETHLDGILEGLIKILLAFLKALCDAILELASFLWSIIKKIVMIMLKPIIDALLDLFKKMNDGIIEWFFNVFKFGSLIPVNDDAVEEAVKTTQVIILLQFLSLLVFVAIFGFLLIELMIKNFFTYILLAVLHGVFLAVLVLAIQKTNEGNDVKYVENSDRIDDNADETEDEYYSTMDLGVENDDASLITKLLIPMLYAPISKLISRYFCQVAMNNVENAEDLNGNPFIKPYLKKWDKISKRFAIHALKSVMSSYFSIILSFLIKGIIKPLLKIIKIKSNINDPGHVLLFSSVIHGLAFIFWLNGMKKWISYDGLSNLKTLITKVPLFTLVFFVFSTLSFIKITSGWKSDMAKYQLST